MEQRNQSEYDVMLNGRSVCIVDLSESTRAYKAWRYIKRFLAMIPASDVEGLGFVILYDDSQIIAESVPGTVRGSYGGPQSESEQARVYIYLNWALGIYPFVPRPTGCSAWNVIRNRVLIALYGKADLARVLFHEIGHHRFSTLLKKRYDSEDQEEREVHDYARTLYDNAFPITRYVFWITRLIATRLIYRQDFKNIVQLWDDWLKKRGYSVSDSRLTDEERKKIAEFTDGGRP